LVVGGRFPVDMPLVTLLLEGTATTTEVRDDMAR
jgi:hypothetical protein